MTGIGLDVSWVGLWDFKLEPVVEPGWIQLLHDFVARFVCGGARFEVAVCAEWNLKFAEPLKSVECVAAIKPYRP